MTGDEPAAREPDLDTPPAGRSGSRNALPSARAGNPAARTDPGSSAGTVIPPASTVAPESDLAVPPEAQADSSTRLQDLHSRTSRGFAWMFLQSIASRLLSTLVFIVLARLLVPSSFGLVALAAVFVDVFRTIVNAGYNEALVQLDKADRRDYDTVFWAGLSFGVGSMALIMVTAPTIADLLDEPGLTPVLRGLSVALVIFALGSGFEAVLQRELKFGRLAARRMIGSIASSTVGLGMAVAGAGVWALVGQTLALAAGSTAALWLTSGYRPGLGFSFRRLRRILKMSVYLLGSSLLLLATRRSDDLLIGAALGVRALGFYSVAYRLLRVMLDVLAMSVHTVAFPAFARLRDSGDRLREAFLSMSGLVATLAVPSFFLVAVTAPEIVTLVFGDIWTPSVPVMRALAVFGALQVTLQLNNSLLNGLGRASTTLSINLVEAATTIAAFVLAVRFGITWVAVALAVRAYLLAPVSFLAVRRHTGLPLRATVGAVLPPFLSAAAMAAACLLLQQELADVGTVWRLAILAAAGAAVYVLLLALFARSYLRDVHRVLRSLLRRKGADRPRRPTPGTDAPTTHENS